MKYPMRTKQKWIVLIFLFALIGIRGCDKDNADEQLPPIIELKDVTKKQVQQLLQGKWKVFKACGGIAGTCEDITGSYREFIGTNKIRFTVDDRIFDEKITKWELTVYGWIAHLNNEDASIFRTTYTNIVNDTLYFSDFTISDSYTWQAVKIK
jgi:hypothetical protein